MAGPVSVSVIIPSHGRHLRLRWLLNALEEQTLPRDQWEVVVVHDYDAETAERVIERHPLTDAGLLRHIRVPEGRASFAPDKRNHGWRAARGEFVAFTDDDCRPDSEWLERLLAAARKPGAGIVQGRTRPDPFERGVLAAPHVRTMRVDPVTQWAQTCNIMYPRDLVERLEGFDEDALTGEDVGLALRAHAVGVDISPAPEALVYHAVESHTLPGMVRQNLKWRHLAYLTKTRPEVRSEFPLGIFWDADHMRTTAAMVGLVAARRSPPLILLAAPYVRRAMRRRGRGKRARVFAAAELPGLLIRQGAEVVGLAAGSVRHRTLVL